MQRSGRSGRGGRSPVVRAAAATLAALMLASCGEVRLDPPPAPTPTLVTTPLATEIPAITVRELMEHKRFREDFGLPSDDAWIQEVARDPASDRRTYGVPLTLAELSDLQDRMVDIDAMRVAIGDYGAAHAHEYAGAFIDQGRGGILVVQFAGSFETHRAAILRLVRPDAPIEVRHVRWSLEELEAYAAQLRGEDAWFRSLPAYLKSYGVRISANRVIIDVSTVVTTVAEAVERRLGWPEGVAMVESDRTGALLLPMGALWIQAVDPRGKPVPGLACVAVPDIDGAYESRPTPMPITDSLGMCFLRLPATGYRIQLERGAGPPTVVAIGRAVVDAARTTEVTIPTP